MKIIPVVTNFEVFSTISYYNYININECILKGMKKNIHLSCELPKYPPSKLILIGRFHHKIMEHYYRSSSITDLKTSIETEILLMQMEVAKWPHLSKLGSVSGWCWTTIIFAGWRQLGLPV